jgi:hypothetical protein
MAGPQKAALFSSAGVGVMCKENYSYVVDFDTGFNCYGLNYFCRVKRQAKLRRPSWFSISARRNAFSIAERSFLGVLDQAVGPEHRVFGKVRVADIAKVKSGLSNSARQGALNRIAAKHFDFVVCRASDLTVLCAVELNDKSHSTKRAKARDQLIENVCKAINLPLLQVAAKAAYSHQDIRNQFHASIGSAVSGESIGT